jgi:hypothetical protein
MKQLKSSSSRLIRLFKQSRDNWKETAISRQRRLRALEIKIRDLSLSRENWKRRAMKAEKELRNKSADSIDEKKDEKGSQEIEIVTATGHHYDVKTIQKAVQQTIEVGSSLRGVETNLKLDASDEELSTPSFSSVRNWLGRIGLYELQRVKEYRNDWIFIIDLTVELGKEKCLVVLGVSQQYLETTVFHSKRGLEHHEVQLLALEIMDSTRGELIEQKLCELTDIVGCPIQIVADHGSDIEKGIKLYCSKYPSIIYTYDVTHAMALFLKHELESSDKYQSFIQKCSQCRHQLQQTELSFISPPSQRSRCRYFNVEKLIDWAQKLLNCPIDTLLKLAPTSDPEILNQKLKDKFDWLRDYQEELFIWGQMVRLTRTLETQLKINGINQQSRTEFELQLQQFLPQTHMISAFQHNILEYITIESSQIPTGRTFLATSDIIESIFGKYKHFSSRSPLKQMGQMVLNISLCTMNLAASVVKEALESVRYLDLKAWSSQVFGQSMLSKRKTVFSPSNDDTEFV